MPYYTNWRWKWGCVCMCDKRDVLQKVSIATEQFYVRSHYNHRFVLWFVLLGFYRTRQSSVQLWWGRKIIYYFQSLQVKTEKYGGISDSSSLSQYIVQPLTAVAVAYLSGNVSTSSKHLESETFAHALQNTSSSDFFSCDAKK